MKELERSETLPPAYSPPVSDLTPHRSVNSQSADVEGIAEGPIPTPSGQKGGESAFVDNNIPYEEDPEQVARHKARLLRRLQDRWACNASGHQYCYRDPDEMNTHVQLTESNLEAWANLVVSLYLEGNVTISSHLYSTAQCLRHYPFPSKQYNAYAI